MRWMVALLFAVALAQGAAKSGSVKAPAKAPASKPDAAIEAEIRTRLAKSKIAKSGFEVRVHQGVATLTGRTDVVQHKGVATRLAKLAGAVEVANQIVVTDRARSKAGAQLAKARETQAKSDPAEKSPPGPRVSQPGITKAAGPDDHAASDPRAQPPPPRPRRATLKR